MNQPALKLGDTMTREEYYRWSESQSSGRYERIDGEIVKIAAERGAHLRMKLAAVLTLRQAIRKAGLECQALPDGATIKTDNSDYEPDAVVNCGTPMDDNALIAPNPVIVVEVLSPGTANTDSGIKLPGYFRVPSIMHYLILHPTDRTVIHHRRSGDRLETTIVAAGPITMDPPGLTITVEDLRDNL